MSTLEAFNAMNSPARLLADPALNCLIAPAVDFQDVPARLPNILNEPGGVLCRLIRYPDAPFPRRVEESFGGLRNRLRAFGQC